MFSDFANNDHLMVIMDFVAGDSTDLESAEKAFKTTTGDFRAKFTAAVRARLAQLATPEVFIELPEHPDQLRKTELEELVRPAAHGFLRSYPSKAELLDQVAAIRRRQERRPAWIPRINRDGSPVPVEQDSIEDAREPDRPLAIAALAELGEVTFWLPETGEDRPELAMAPGGIGEWEAALHTLLGLVGDNTSASTVTIDAAANEALVPDEVRWWPTRPAPPVTAAEDPGVASELLATSPTLGGLPITDDTPDACEAVADALLCAGDWRYSPQWLLETRGPGDGAATLAVARAAVAGWADEHRSGLVVYVYGGALHGEQGLISAPAPLHSYLLAVTRSPDGTDTVDALHRIALSCPGENWCRRGGCPDVDFLEVAALLTPIVTTGHAAQAAGDSSDGRWAESHGRLYGDGDGPEYPDSVLEHLAAVLSGSGWVELQESAWEGGMEEVLLRRDGHCLTASYDPVTRQVRLSDGKNDLDGTLQLLADDGLVVGDDSEESVDVAEATDRWDSNLPAAADDFLHGRITALPQLAAPVQVTVLGLHPHADGTLRGPHAAHLTQHQLSALCSTVDLLTTHARPVHGGNESAQP